MTPYGFPLLQSFWAMPRTMRSNDFPVVRQGFSELDAEKPWRSSKICSLIQNSSATLPGANSEVAASM